MRQSDQIWIAVVVAMTTTLAVLIANCTIGRISKIFIYLFIYFYLYIYPPDSQESDGGANT